MYLQRLAELLPMAKADPNSAEACTLNTLVLARVNQLLPTPPSCMAQGRPQNPQRFDEPAAFTGSHSTLAMSSLYAALYVL